MDAKNDSPCEEDGLRKDDGKSSKRALSNMQRLCYGVGHVFNDLVAAMWFSYMLLYLTEVENFDNVPAGNLMLIGQIADAICTPLIGMESDRTKKGFFNLGKRKTWHLVVFANISVFGVFSLLFLLSQENSSDTSGSSGVELSSSDVPKFRYLSLTCLGIGFVFNVIFYAGTSKIPHSIQQGEKGDAIADIRNGAHGDKEKGYDSIDTKAIDKSNTKSSLYNMSWGDWLREHQFYQVALLYMFTRLYFNISQVYFGIYLTKTLKMKKMFVAILPLVLFGASFLASMLSPSLNKAVGRKLAYVVGVAFGISANTWLYLMDEGSNQIYGAVMFLGITDSFLLIASLSMVSDLIADNVESGAFVFGAMSFTDKLSNGLSIVIIQKLDPCSSETCASSAGYYRYIESLVPGGAVVCAFLVLLTLMPQAIGTRRKKHRNDSVKDPNNHSSKQAHRINQASSNRQNGSIQYDDDPFGHDGHVYSSSDNDRLMDIY